MKLLRPQKGEKKALVDMASKDVVEMVKTIDEKAALARERRYALGSEIFDVLRTMGAARGEYSGRDFRAEAYDISNTNGVDTVAAMVVFEGLDPDRQSYRKFRIRSIQGQDDYGSMREVLSRRFRRVFEGDEKFEVLPDYILMDGGKGHVSAALEVIDKTGFDIPVIGMVKDDRHRTRALVYRRKAAGAAGGDIYEEIPLKGKPLLFSYTGRIQEEVHRFAIDYHHRLRNRNAVVSVLDEIPGIGPARRRALLEHFKSVDAVKKASVDMLEGVKGMNASAARNVWDYLHGRQDNMDD